MQTAAKDVLGVIGKTLDLRASGVLGKRTRRCLLSVSGEQWAYILNFD